MNQTQRNILWETPPAEDTDDQPAELVDTQDAERQTKEPQNSEKVDNSVIYLTPFHLTNMATNGKKYFLVKWQVSSVKTWEPEEHINKDLIHQYHITMTQTGRARRRRTKSF